VHAQQQTVKLFLLSLALTMLRDSIQISESSLCECYRYVGPFKFFLVILVH